MTAPELTPAGEPGASRPRLTGADVLAASLVHSTITPCKACGCDPRNPWYCGCSNPDCPCSEDEEEG